MTVENVRDQVTLRRSRKDIVGEKEGNPSKSGFVPLFVMNK